MRKWQEDINGGRDLREFYLEHVEELGKSASESSVSEVDLEPERQVGMVEYVPELELHSWHCAGQPIRQGKLRQGLPDLAPVQHKIGKLIRRPLEFQFPLLKHRYGLLQCQGQPLANAPFDQVAEVWLQGAQGWFKANNYRVEIADTEKRFYPELTGHGLILVRAEYANELANQALLAEDFQPRRKTEPLRQQVQRDLDRLELSVTISALVES